MPPSEPTGTITTSKEQIGSCVTTDTNLFKQNYTPEATRCYFFSLPLELREMIYEHAFGTHLRFFCVKSLKDIAVVATLEPCPPFDTLSGEWLVSYKSRTQGLPRWIMTCKQICTEAVEAFLRTRRFVPLELGHAWLFRIVKPVGNSLIFSSRKIRNIAIPQKFRMTYVDPNEYGYDEGLIRATRVKRYIRPGTQAFLSYIRQQQLQELTLELRWDRSWHGKGGSRCITWLDCEREAFDVLDSTWSGIVKRLRLTMVYHSKTGNGVEKLMEMAEICARRLIGTGRECSLTWGDEIEGKKYFSMVRLDIVEVGLRKSWERTLLACRK